MNTKAFALAAGLLALASAPAVAATHVGVSIFLGDAPPPPVIAYHAPPPMAYFADSRVYVINDDRCAYDLFRYGQWYYVYNSGTWYRGPAYRGPFRAIREDFVPRPIFAVNDRDYRWRHHPHGGPPGLVRKTWRDDDGGGDGNGRSHGHGRDHGGDTD